MPARMKKLLFPVIALAAVCLTPTPLRADDSPMAKQMEGLDDAYKAFRREKDPDKGAAAARDAQEAVLKAIPMVPELVGKIGDAKEKAKALVSYRKQMAQLYVTLCDVEAAFLAGETDKVTELVEALKAHKKEGHNAFIEEEE